MDKKEKRRKETRKQIIEWRGVVKTKFELLQSIPGRGTKLALLENSDERTSALVLEKRARRRYVSEQHVPPVSKRLYFASGVYSHSQGDEIRTCANPRDALVCFFLNTTKIQVKREKNPGVDRVGRRGG